MSKHDFFENILENMADGVMAIDFQGRIIMFNTAAGDMLGLAPEKIINDTFARVFLTGMDENDDFNQLVLDAVYEQGIGLSSTVDFTRYDKRVVTLSVRSSYLSENDKDKKGVILVFSDVTELKKMQARQEEDARKLGKAYQDLEQKNEELQKAAKRVQVVRFVSTLLIIGLFLSIGIYHFQGDNLLKAVQSARSDDVTRSQDETVHVTVSTRPVSTSVSLVGSLEPLEEIVVTAPFDGRILERNFSFGQMVEQGEVLILIDSSDLEINLRNARSDYIKTRQRYNEILNWDTGLEMTRARRSLVRAEDSLELQERKLEEAELLFGKGVIPGQELENAQRQHQNAVDEVRSSRDELETVREKGSRENIELVEMELENARVNLEKLEVQIEQRKVRAPVSGVVIQPVGEDGKKTALERGSRVSAGTSLFAVGDLKGMTVSTKVDEVDVRKIFPGQSVRARGDAFPGVTLQGEVSHISAQAVAGSGRQGATFDVRVTFPELDEKSLEYIRVGMSADLEVVVYENDNAMMVPLSFVRVVRGASFVRLVGPDGQVREREVETGITTLRDVEIVSGVEAGQRLAQW
ncbi:efflux RND transporter periplasmic adaptor subunit [Desulfonatronovibrio magnus]|uniref:efflux RND transporter periplasmic adaptor subunit n=1 Tax=Desulfonatronovibrio magnus TaxID=698827 RepID=UPI0006985792|nr:HlyD family efflux transporter periplasmic adaptor subunit [Desulfonatronovibrio magnus]